MNIQTKLEEIEKRFEEKFRPNDLVPEPFRTAGRDVVERQKDWLRPEITKLLDEAKKECRCECHAETWKCEHCIGAEQRAKYKGLTS